MKRLCIPSLLLFFIVNSVNVYAKNTDISSMLSNRNSIEFIENKGQILDQKGNINDEVIFMAQIPGGAVYVKANEISFANYDTSKQANKQVYRVDMKFNGANSHPIFQGIDEYSDKNNYFLAHCPDGIINVSKYKRIVIKDIYPQIDFILYPNLHNTIQYDFIVKPGGNPDIISLSFSGCSDIHLSESGSLQLLTPFGTIEQGAPRTYQDKEIASSFIVNTDNTVSFKVDSYDHHQSLRIDPPTRMWGTYFGGAGADIGSDLAIDQAGNIFICGQTNSAWGIATNGSYQTNLSANTDGFIAKFNNTGVRLWSTYYGGTGDEIAQAIAIDNALNVYICGTTNSAASIATAGAPQTVLGGNNDAFLVKFTNNGTRTWGTYLGGSGEDKGLTIKTDASGNIAIAGLTNSANGIATAGALQSNLGGGYDGFLAKYASAGQLTWCTYYGGTSDDKSTGIAIDASGKILLRGDAISANGIATAGSYQPNNLGGSDSYIAKFDASGTRDWATYYGGTSDDYGSAIHLDVQGSILIIGHTNSFNSISSSGSYQQGLQGSFDGYLAKFDANGNRAWGTYYGGSNNELCTGLATDSYGNIVITGTTNSISAIASIDGYQQSLSGEDDGFMAKFNASGSRIWGSYYGGIKTDNCNRVAFDASNELYVCGTSNSNSDITTNGSYQATSNGLQEAFLVRFMAIDPSISCTTPQTELCAGSTLTVNYTISGQFAANNVFTVQLSSINGSFVNPTIIGTKTANTSGSIVCTFPSNISGSGYRIRILSNSPFIASPDNAVDLNLVAVPTSIIIGQSSTCQTNQTYSIPVIKDCLYSWTEPSKGKIIGNANNNEVIIKWNSVGTDTLKLRVTKNPLGCYKDTTIIITINANPVPIIQGNGNVCIGQLLTYKSTPNEPGFTYEWSTKGKGVLSGPAGQINAVYEWKAIGTDTLTLKKTNVTTGCTKDTSIIVTINPLPIPIIKGPNTICGFDKPVEYSASSSTSLYTWSIESGKASLSSDNEAITKITFGGIGNVLLRLTERTLAGCIKDTSITITVKNSINPEFSAVNGKNQFCKGDSIQLMCSLVAAGYQWKLNGNDIIDAIGKSYTAKIPGTYSVLVKTSDCQALSQEKELIELPLPMPIITGPKEIKAGESDIQYIVQSNQGSTYSWLISGNGIINGKTDESTVSISSTNPGTLQLTVIEISAAGCRKDTFMTISIANPQGINELKSEQISILSIQPNPSDNSQILNIVCEFPLMSSPIIELVDMLGIVHYSMQSMQSKDESIQHIAIPLSKISSGMYIIRLSTNTQTVSQKFLIH